MKTVLVAYFSATGTTARVAKTAAEAMDADLYEITPETPYSAADLDWQDKGSRSYVEMHDAASRPKLAGKLPSLAPYQTVLIGFPIWWDQAPHIVNTFMENVSLSGKTVLAFATSGGSGITEAEKILKKSAAGAEWHPGRVFPANVAAPAIKAWVENGRLAARGLRPKAGGKAMFAFLKDALKKK